MDRGGLVLVRLAGRHIYPIPLRTSYYDMSMLPAAFSRACLPARLFTRSHKITRMLASLCVKVCWGLGLDRSLHVRVVCLTVTISVNVEGCV